MRWHRKGKTSDTKSDIFHAPGGEAGSFYSMERVYVMMTYCCLLYIGLTWYFDHVIPNAYGLASHPLFFLDPAYWGFTSAKKTRPPIGDAEEDPDADVDVKAEAAFVEEGDFSRRAAVAVVIKGLQKTVHPMLCDHEFLDSNHFTLLAYFLCSSSRASMAGSTPIRGAAPCSTLCFRLPGWALVL